MRSKIKDYYNLTKPGIVYANTFSAVAGYLYATSWKINLAKFIGLVIGNGLLIASACVYNNYLDIPIDKLMSRTAKRELPTAKISIKSAKIFLAILFLIGLTCLIIFTNVLTVIIGLVAYIFYVFVYGYFKRYSKWGTLVGTLPGSASVIAGYVAYKNTLDMTSLFLLLIMASWQMAHFYAISVYRHDDYRVANLPVWSVSVGIKNTIKWILFYMVMFLFLNIGFGLLTNVGLTYTFIMLIVSYVWIYLSVKQLSKISDTLWAKDVFKKSLLVNLIFMLTLALVRI